MGNPLLDSNSSLGLKKEVTAGTRITLATGANFLDLVSADIGHDPQMLELDSPLGDRQKQAPLSIISHTDGKGSFVYRPRNADIDTVLELLFGATNTGYWVPVTDGTDLPTFTLENLLFNLTEYALAGCKVNTLELTSETNQPLIAALELLAMSGETDPGDLTTADHTAWYSDTPFMHGTLTFDATAHAWLGGASGPPIRKLNLKMSNNLDPDGFTNSTDRKIIPVGMFSLEGSMEIPYNSESDGFLTDWAAAGKVKATMTWQNMTAPLDTLEVQMVVKLDSGRPQITGDGSHKWMTIAFHGVADNTDLFMCKAKYTAGV